MDAYERSARVYDLVQHARGRDVAAQAAVLAALIHERHPAARSLLDVACGTGRHLVELRRHFADVAGVDLSHAMLDRARTLLPDVALEAGDMRTFRLDRRFDAVTCLFSSIGYLLTIDDLGQAITNMATHLDQGGVLIVEPWIHPGEWRPGHRVAEAINEDGFAVSRVAISGQEGHISTFDLYWTIASDDGVEQFAEPHRMGLYSADEYRHAFEAAGLTVEHDPEGLIGRGLFIGRPAR